MALPTRVEPPRVLFVDDNADVTEILVLNIARHCEIESVRSESALHAIQILRSQHFDLLVTDFSMPGMHGGDLVLFAHEKWPDMRRILLTAHSSADMLREYEDVADEVLDKLLDIWIICEKICRHAKTPRQRP